MPRHFYLRLPHTNFPIASVATAEDHCVEDGKDIIEVRFAVATYNPSDAGKLPFRKSWGKNRAIGLLSTNKDGFVTCINVPSGTPGIEIKRAVVQSIASGEWAELHPGAAAAKLAAHHWLNQYEFSKIEKSIAIYTTPELTITETSHPLHEDHAIDNMENEGAPPSHLPTTPSVERDFSFHELSIPPAEACIATRYANDDIPTPAEELPITFTTDDDIRDGETVCVHNNRPFECLQCHPINDNPPDTIEDAVERAREPEIVMTVREGDQEKLDRIFSGTHRTENESWSWSTHTLPAS